MRRPRFRAGCLGPSIVHPQTIRALIEACCWVNIRMEEKYTWGKEKADAGLIRFWKFGSLVEVLCRI